jgi:hypothetical protein
MEVCHGTERRRADAATGEELMAFLYSTLSGPANVPAQDASELLGESKTEGLRGHALDV